MKLFESAPSLRTVRVHNLVSSGMLRLPWVQLTRYEDTMAFGIPKAFRSNSRLRNLKFSPNRSAEELGNLPRIQWMPLMIPYLTTLSIEFWDTRYKVKTLFDNLTLPALHTLVLKFSKYDNVMDVELVNMINRSHCGLKHFTFYGRDSPIKEFLAVMPSLTTLDINDPNSELIEKLFQFRNGAWTVLHYLSSLTIHLSKFHKQQYLAMLSRLAGIRCDTVSAFRDDQPSLPMLKTFKVAIHGTEDHYLGRFYYASLEPPTTEMEARSAKRISSVYASMMNDPVISDPSSSITPSELNEASRTLVYPILWAWNRRREKYAKVMSDLKDILESDPHAVAGIYVRTLNFESHLHMNNEFFSFLVSITLCTGHSK